MLGTLEGRRLVYVGDGNNVAASLAYAAALSGVELTVASPPGYELDDAPSNVPATSAARSSSSPIPTKRSRGADAVYTDVWTSMGQEAEQRAAASPRSPATRSTPHSWRRREQAWFLHCLPAHRGEEVTADVVDGPRSAVWQQAANRMHAARAAPRRPACGGVS